MLLKTKGLVLSYLKYGDTSIIVKIFTEEVGLQTYIVNGVRSAKSKSRIALFQPLTLLDLVVYYRKNKTQIFRISEAKCLFPFQTIPFHFKKSGISLFIAEILSKSFQDEYTDKELFAFLQNAVSWLDIAQEQLDNFHLIFLLKLSRYLGFEPSDAEEIFLQISEHKKLWVSETELEELKWHFDQLIVADFNNSLKISSKMRSEMIDYLLLFYALHLPNFDSIKSLSVLRELNR